MYPKKRGPFILVRLLILLSVFSLLLTKPSRANTASFQETNKIITLAVGQTVKRKIRDAESHSYNLLVRNDQYVQIVAQQSGVDLIVRLFDSAGAEQAEMDSPNGAYGTEPLCFISTRTDVYRLEVRKLEAEAITGSYTLSVADLRTATAADRSRFNAQQIFSEAEELRNKGEAAGAKEALAKYDAAYTLYSSLNDSRGAAISLYGRAATNQSLGDNAKAFEDFKNSSQLWRLTTELSARANTLNSLGLVADDLGQKERSLNYYKESLRLFRTLGDKREVANTLANIGRLNVSLGNYLQALGLFNSSLKFFQRIGETSEAATLLTNLSVVYENLGDYEAAISKTSEALKLLRQIGDKRGEAYALVSMGNVHFGLGSLQKALDTYSQALPLFEQLGNRSLQSQVLNNIGKCHLALGARQLASDNISRALELAKSTGDHRRQAYYLNNMAILQSDGGDLATAERTYLEALAMMREIKNQHGEAQVLDNLGTLYVSKQQRQQALDTLTRALSLKRALNEVPGEGNTLANLMFAWQRFQQPRLAVLYGKQAINRFQLTRNRISRLEQELQASYLTSKEKVYRELVNLLISQGRLAEAQQVLRLLKEEEYFKFIRGSSATDKPNEGVTLTPEEAEWSKRYNEISNRIASIGHERGKLREKLRRTPLEEQRLIALEKDLEVANQRFQSFLDELSATFGNTSASTLRLTALRDAQALQTDLRDLGKGTVALFTVVSDEKYSVILVTPDTQLAREYPIKAAELNQKVFDFRQTLQRPDIDPRPLAQELYKVLIGPIVSDLKQTQAKTLMWSLDGSLRYLPVAALHDGSSYLVEQYQSVVFTPASNARLKDRPRPHWTGLGLGVSKAVENFPPLEGVPVELRSIIRAPGLQRTISQIPLGLVPGKVLLDDAFTRSAMRSELRRNYRLVHIASHFLFKPGNENDSFLLLGNGEHLTLSEIKRAVTMFHGVELLTLSACDTATGGADANGKEVEGFAVLAQRQGAKSVMASLWPVADNSTRLLMQEFYRLRTSTARVSKAEALRQAQLQLLSGRGRPSSHRSIKLSTGTNEARVDYSHPFFWAPFILIGNWQ